MKLESAPRVRARARVLAVWPAALLLASCAALCLPGLAGAQLASPSPPVLLEAPGRTVAGVSFPGAQLLGDAPLSLRGVGVRAKMIIKVYAAGLYLPPQQAVQDPTEVPQLACAHRLQLVMLRDVDGPRMSDGLAHAMLEGLDEAHAQAIRARVQELAQALLAHGDVHRGDVIWVDYRPERGTRVSIGGQAVTPDIAGGDFNAAMTGMWLGAHAPDAKLRAALVGQTEP